MENLPEFLLCLVVPVLAILSLGYVGWFVGYWRHKKTLAAYQKIKSSRLELLKAYQRIKREYQKLLNDTKEIRRKYPELLKRSLEAETKHEKILDAFHLEQESEDPPNLGEFLVRQSILADFDLPNYHLINDITLPAGGGTTQIDHVLFSTKGIFVIETKHYAGWIFGDKKAKTWAQVVYHKKSRFQNPIRQNYKHLKIVQELLDFLPSENIHSLVVFTGSAEFKTQIPDGVCYLDDLPKQIKSFRKDVISENRMQFCVGRLECTRYERTKTTADKHKIYLKEKYG